MFGAACSIRLAEREGFEPSIPCRIHDFQSCALDRTMRPLRVWNGIILDNERLFQIRSWSACRASVEAGLPARQAWKPVTKNQHAELNPASSI